jgi:hypothetical protein
LRQTATQEYVVPKSIPIQGPLIFPEEEESEDLAPPRRDKSKDVASLNDEDVFNSSAVEGARTGLDKKCALDFRIPNKEASAIQALKKAIVVSDRGEKALIFVRSELLLVAMDVLDLSK